MTYNEAQHLYFETWNAIIKEFKDDGGVYYTNQPNFRASHMITITPRFDVQVAGKHLGTVTFDKSTVCPSRYVSIYTGVTGGRGGNGDINSVAEIVAFFRLMYECVREGKNKRECLKKGSELGIREGAISYYFKR
jgi:hypothetical protein